jgi:hypothetical protein
MSQVPPLTLCTCTSPPLLLCSPPPSFCISAYRTVWLEVGPNLFTFRSVSIWPLSNTHCHRLTSTSEFTQSPPSILIVLVQSLELTITGLLSFRKLQKGKINSLRVLPVMSLEPLYYFSRAFAACRSLLCSDRGPSSYGGLGVGARAGRRGEVLSAYGAAKKARLWGGDPLVDSGQLALSLSLSLGRSPSGNGSPYWALCYCPVSGAGS